VVHAPLGIIGLPDVLAPYVKEDGRISLSDLANALTLRMGKPLARRYPDVLQQYVDKVSKTSHFAELTGENATVRVLEQIALGRIDYTLEYPSILKFHNLTHGEKALVYYETTELSNKGISGAIGCTNNAWGEEAVSTINKALPVILSSPIYQKQQQFWHANVVAPDKTATR
jgi:uncharacterized protein (TIGR02285 family)